MLAASTVDGSTRSVSARFIVDPSLTEVGAVNVAVGLTLATFSVASSVVNAVSLSVTFRVNVNVPLSVHVTVVAASVASPNEQIPAGVTDQRYETAPPSGSLPEPPMLIALPSLPG